MKSILRKATVCTKPWMHTTATPYKSSKIFFAQKSTWHNHDSLKVDTFNTRGQLVPRSAPQHLSVVRSYLKSQSLWLYSFDSSFFKKSLSSRSVTPETRVIASHTRTGFEFVPIHWINSSRARVNSRALVLTFLMFAPNFCMFWRKVAQIVVVTSLIPCPKGVEE